VALVEYYKECAAFGSDRDKVRKNISFWMKMIGFVTYKFALLKQF